MRRVDPVTADLMVRAQLELEKGKKRDARESKRTVKERDPSEPQCVIA